MGVPDRHQLERRHLRAKNPRGKRDPIRRGQGQDPQAVQLAGRNTGKGLLLGGRLGALALLLQATPLRGRQQQPLRFAGYGTEQGAY